MRRTVLIVALLAILGLAVIVVAASVLPKPNDTPAGPTPTPSVVVDPYDMWLDHAPPDAPEMTRDEALVRAQLGCGQDWPPGTTDAILAEVYADYVAC